MLFSDKYPKLFDIFQASLFFVFLLSLQLFIPPMQSPDEISHITRAAFLSEGQLFPGKNSEGVAGGPIDRNLLSFIRSYENIPFHPESKVTHLNRQFDQLTWAGDDAYVGDANTLNVLPIVYIPQAFGLFLGRALNLTLQDSYFLSRLLYVLSIVAILSCAFRMVPANAFVSLILLLPMSLFQFASPTIDGLVTALVVLALAMFIKISKFKENVSSFTFVLLVIVLAVIIGAKLYLFPMILLLILLCFYQRTLLNLILVLVLLSLIGGWVVFIGSHGADVRLVSRPPNSEIIRFYLANPTAYLRVLKNTFSYKDLMLFHIESFIGILGWLDTRLKEWMYPIFETFLSLAIISSISMPKCKKDFVIKASLVLISLTSIWLIYTFMLLGWSKHPAIFIEGVQGRYFLTPLLILGYAFSYQFQSEGSPFLMQKGLGYIAVGSICVLSMATPWILYSRYQYFLWG